VINTSSNNDDNERPAHRTDLIVAFSFTAADDGSPVAGRMMGLGFQTNQVERSSWLAKYSG
jgi:hypothetical protein